MANINRDYLIILDVKTGEVDSPNIYYFNTDKNTSNLYVQMVIKETNIEATPIDNATDYSIKANVIKPDLDFIVLDGTLVNEEKAIYEFNLTEECINLSGNCKIEFEVFSKVNNIEESITSFSTKFKVFPSILTDTNKPTETSSDYPILKKLIKDIEEMKNSGQLGHEHTNKTVIDSITSTKVNNWDTAYDHSQSTHFDGNYNSLSNKPTIPPAYTHPTTHPASMITGLSSVATSGSYNDLTNKPTIPNKTSELNNDSGFITSIPSEYITEDELSTMNYATKSELHSHDNKTVLDGITSDKVTAWDNKSDFSGSYNDLTDKPTIPEAYVLPIANQTTLGGVKVGTGLAITTDGILSAIGGGTADSVEWDNVLNKPTFATVATSGSYNDLTDKPTIPKADTLVTTNISGTTLTLTADKYQATTMVNGTTITLPTVTDYTEIHLFFTTAATLTLTMPSVKWQNTPSIEANKTYEFIFTYVNNTIGWLAGYIAYS